MKRLFIQQYLISYISILLRFFLGFQGFLRFGVSVATPFLHHSRMELHCFSLENPVKLELLNSLI